MSEGERLTRVAVPEMDEILGRTYKVLDDGFVRVVDYLGGDASIVQAARVSYGVGTKTVHEDAGLIRYLMRHQHTTPFEMCEIKLHVRAPMDTWRQWIRHRTANVNEYSTRYSIAIDAAARTDASAWRRQASGRKQGSEGTIPVEIGATLSNQELELHQRSRAIYEERITRGVAREQARKDLPLSTYTEAYWKIDLHNLCHFLSLRMDSHAQEEIRAYALTIGSEIVSRWCPVAWRAFCDYRLNAVTLTGLESQIVRLCIAGDVDAAMALAGQWGWTKSDEHGLRPNRERSEAEEKLAVLGLRPPWTQGVDQ